MKTKKQFHKLTAWLLTLAMLMTFIPNFTLAASAAQTYEVRVFAQDRYGDGVAGATLQILDIDFKIAPHEHPLCGTEHANIGDHTGACSDITWTKWDSANSMPTEAGAYYFDGDVVLSSSWEIPEGVEISLCLNGHSVSGNHAVRVVTINKTATLNLCDCSTAQTGKITEGYSSNTSGAGVWVAKDSRFNMYGGSIVQNKTPNQGGGVYIFQGTFNMYGGVVSENTASDGAGVYNNEGTLSIYADGITNNIASRRGGGVFNSGKFNMTGGTISANKVTGYQQYCHGGGVNHNGGTFEMSGGTIFGNSAETGAGIYVAFLSKWLVSGTPAIHDAICLNSNQYGTSYITVSGALSDGASFAATNRGVGETIVIGTDTYFITENDAAKFATNEGKIYLDSVGNRLVLCNDSHPEYENGACKTCGAECEHSLVYESNQNVITERCNAESLCGHEEKATLSANTQIYSGSTLTPATISYSEGWRGERVEESAITYSQNINVGTAFASVEIEGETITTPFEICPEHIESATITLNPTSGNYNGTEQKPDISVSYGGALLTENTDYTLSWNKSGLKNADNYTVTITGMGNFAYETQKTFDITPKEIEFAWGGVNFMPYTGQLVLPEVTVTNLADGDTCEVLVSVVETVDGAGVNPGKWTARITSLSNGNYKLPENSSVPLEVEYTIYAHQTAPDVSGVAETIKGKNDGYISGLTTEMEYATEPTNLNSAYTKITDPDMIFAPGTYYVRYTAKDYYYSSPYTVVTVAEGRKLTVTLPQTQAGYTLTVDKTDFAYNDSLQFTFILHDGYTITDDYSAKFNDMVLPLHDNSAVVDACTEDVVVTVEGIADITLPDAEIKIADDSWTSFWNNLTFGLFFKETQDVTITADDAGSGVKNIQYYLTDRELERGEVETITDWVDYNGTFKIDPDNRYAVYAKITDNDGNVAYINSEGIVLDATVPVIEGIENGKTCYTTQRFTVKESNLESVTVNGNPSMTFALGGNIDKEYVVVATDKAGNTTTVTVTMKPISDLSAPIDNLTRENVNSSNEDVVDGIKAAVAAVDKTNATEAEKHALKDIADKAAELEKVIDDTKAEIVRINEKLNKYQDDTVKSTDKDAIEQVIEDIDSLLETENLTENEKKALEDAKVKADDLLDAIEDAAKAPNTENTEKVKDVAAENVTPENKTDLENAKDDLEKALDDNSSNYTEDEKKAIEDEIKRIDDALEVIGNVEAVEELIDKLSDTIKKDDEPAIKAADDAYNALTDYEKSLVDENEKKALDDAKAALVELNKPVTDTDSPQTGDNSNMFLWIALLFISGGAVITLTVVDRKRRLAK